MPYNITMNTRPFFVRNARAASLYEYFFVSAAASILLIRAFLALTDYPQLGPGHLHIAHMLYGGIFMIASILISFSSLGHRSLSLAAFIGGTGFGFFIDELGKFITKDNDYFYKPTSVIIYLIFVLLFFVLRRLSRERTYTRLEYTVNSVAMLEEVILQDLDGTEHRQLQTYLHKADQNDPIIRQLRNVIAAIPESTIVEYRRFDRIRTLLEDWVASLVAKRKSRKIITAVYLTQAVISLEILVFSVATTYAAHGHTLHAIPLPQIAQLASASISFLIVMLGSYYVLRDRAVGFELFRRAILLDLLVTEPFVFYSEQFLAVFGLAFKLIMWTIILNFIAVENHENKHPVRKLRTTS